MMRDLTHLAGHAPIGDPKSGSNGVHATPDLAPGAACGHTPAANAGVSRRTAMLGLLALGGCASGPYTNTEYARSTTEWGAGPSWPSAANGRAQGAPSGAQIQSGPPPKQASSGIVGAPGYRLGPNDRVRITVFGEDRLSGEFALDGQGVISLPLIGPVQARGATTDELSDAVRNALAGRFILNPRVAVEVTSYRPFFILGEVNEPGEYPFSAGLTVLGAVALAKGFTVRADEGVAEISRAGASRAVRARISPNTPVNPGDVITIPQRWF